MPALTARKVETLREPGLYGDGGGLYLRVGPTGAKSWILRTVVHGKRRETGPRKHLSGVAGRGTR